MYNIVSVLNAIKYYTLKGLISCYVNFISVKNKEQKKKENRVRITAVRDEQLENLGYLKT